MRSEAVAESASLVGQCFAERYALEARIGSGASGETYRARHVDDARTVAVKVFREDVGEDALRQRRFELEMSKLTALEHPSMPATLAFGVHGGRRFVVREWLEGETLAERLARGPVSLEVAMTIARQVLAALAAVHGAKLLHRDLHPSNVFLETRRYGGERVKLIDFSPAARESRQATPFRAPEVDTGAPLDARSDVFAVGALVSAMLRPAVSDAAGAGASSASVASSVSATTGSASASDDRSSRPSSDAYGAQGALASAAVAAVLSASPAGAAAGVPLAPATGRDQFEQSTRDSASVGLPTEARLDQSTRPSGRPAKTDRRAKAQRRRERRARRKSVSPGVPTKVQPNGHGRNSLESATAAGTAESQARRTPNGSESNGTELQTNARASGHPRVDIDGDDLLRLTPSAPPESELPAHALLEPNPSPDGSAERLVSAFETSFAAPIVAAPEPSPSPAPEPENPLQRWIGRAMAEDRTERFDDAADMLRELVDRLPRELRVAADESARTRRAASPVDSPADGGSSDLDADAATAEAAAVLSPAKQAPRATPQLTAAPGAHSNATDALLEVDPVSLHGPGEPGMSQLTAATAIGAFTFAAIVIIVMPGDLGRAHRAPAEPQARVAEPIAPPRTETRVEAAKAPRPPSIVPLSAIAPLAPTRVSIAPPRAAAPVVAVRPKPLSEARDPWLDPIPKELQRFRANALSGAPGDKSTIEALRVYNRTNSKDPRGFLIAARFYMNRLWRTDGVGQYAAAIERDPSARGAPEILPALLECVAEGKAAPAAEALIEKVYGTGAVPAIDRALDKAKSQTTALRLSTLSEKLLAKAP